MTTVIGGRIYKISTEWTSENPVLAEGQEGVESDTDFSKIGDGVSSWTALPYWALTPAGGGGGTSISTTIVPAPDTPLGGAGTGPYASPAGHSHPLSLLGRSPVFGLVPPAMVADLSFDGVWNGTAPTNYAYFGGGGSFASLTGSSYSANTNFGPFDQPVIWGRDITLGAGITLYAPGSSPGNQRGLAIVASRTLTISGTINAVGANAVGATGGAATSNWSQYWGGGSGASGSTGAGTQGQSAYNGAQNSCGGGGGAGGASGATAGGSASYQPEGFSQGIDLDAAALMFLRNTGTYGSNGNSYLGGGSGGSSGAGDGTNAGGGGGAGGANVILIAPEIIITSTAQILTTGGNGAAGVAGNAGGGGGGGGGAISIHGLSVTIQTGAVFNVAGGLGGAGAGTGSPGNPGTSASYFTDPPVIYGGYGYGPGLLICQWQ